MSQEGTVSLTLLRLLQVSDEVGGRFSLHHAGLARSAGVSQVRRRRLLGQTSS